MRATTAIVARPQLGLGVLRCLELAASSLRHRWFRSGITMAILALAVAFLVHTLSFGVLARGMRHGAERELAESRRWGELSRRLGTADAAQEIERGLAEGNPERLAEYRHFAGPGVALDEACASARALGRLGEFLNELPAAPRSVLLGDRNLDELWAALAQPDARARFLEQLARFRLRLPGLSSDDLDRLISLGRPRLQEVSAAISAGHQRALEQLGARFADRTALSLALDPPAGWAEALAQAGFALSASDLAALSDRARSVRARTQLRQLLLDPQLRSQVGQALHLKPDELSAEVLAHAVDSTARAAWLGELLGAREPALRVSGAELYAWLQSWDRERSWLAVVEADSAPASGSAFSSRTLWLVALSFIVCAVGVANALFMSVTERFSEIATMKCLGALDGVVLLLFVFEAMLQGLAGGLIGVLLGLALALGRGLLEFGSLSATAWAARGQLLSCSMGCLFAGVLLSALAALGPAWAAARLLPMEAMRVD